MNDLIQIIKILEKEEVEEVNRYIDTLKLHESTVFGKGTKQDTSSGRTSTGTTLNENHSVTLNLHNKINEGLLEYKRRVEKIHQNFSYYPVPGGISTRSWREGIQVLQYEKSQEYRFHHDVADDRELKEYHRQISVIVYLTEGFTGGGTAFTHATYKPKPGYALMFPSNWCYPHAGEPVESGIKRVAVTWYYVINT